MAHLDFLPLYKNVAILCSEVIWNQSLRNRDQGWSCGLVVLPKQLADSIAEKMKNFI